MSSLLVPAQPGSVLEDFSNLFISDTPLIDVRAPVEFAKGAFPGSVNLPLLGDEERHLVGIKYKQEGQQSAIELGAELLEPSYRELLVKNWLDFIERHPNCSLYCFRGGLRSRIAQQWLRDAGNDIPLIKGGYKALRRFLIDSLAEICEQLDFVLIGGRTGNGKTLLLKRLQSSVDLEHLANHRGSSFGGMVVEQPSNIDFENAVTVDLLKLKNNGATSIYLEDEARLIGRVCLPDVLRQSMQRAPIYILECELEQRVSNCFDDYVTDLLGRYVKLYGNDDDGFQAYAEHHGNSLARIRKRFGGANYNHAVELMETALYRHRAHNDTSAYRELIRLLLCNYYDPMYDYQISGKKDRIVFNGTADQIITRVKTH